MSLITIDALPEEILIEIFGYLSPNMMKTCTLVCSRWNSIIGNLKEFTKIFRLNLDSQEDMEEYKLKEFKRKYGTIRLDCEVLGNFLDLINPQCVHTLEICCEKIEPSQLIDALNNLPALEVLAIKNMFCSETDKTKYKKIAKKAKLNIKKLFLKCAYYFLKFLDVETLEEFLIESCEENLIDVIKFLKRQEQLQILLLGKGATCEFFDYPEIFQFKFRLSTFILCGEAAPSEILKKFLLIHKDTLKTLRLCIMNTGISFEIYKFIWNNLSLINIDINALRFGDFDDYIDYDPEYTIQYTPKFPVETVIFLGEVYEDDIGSNFFKKVLLTALSNAKSVYFGNMAFDNFKWYENIQHMCDVMQNLKILRMPYYFETRIFEAETIHFPKLQEFRMNEITDEKFSHFIRRHSKTLQKVSFRWTDKDFMEPIINELLNCEKLKVVKIRANILEALSLYNKFDSKKNNYWILKLKIRFDWLNYFKFSYAFPDDKAIWDAHYAVLSKGNITLDTFINELRDFVKI